MRCFDSDEIDIIEKPVEAGTAQNSDFGCGLQGESKLSGVGSKQQVSPLQAFERWFYHLLILTAVCFALRSLVIARLEGKSFKGSVEATLELGSEIPGELPKT